MAAVGHVSSTGDPRKVAKAGDTMTGELTLPDSSPDTALAAASKGYVDAQVATAQQASPWVFDVTASAYGAVGDAQVVADGAMTSGSAVLTSATANWPSTVVGKSISVKGAGPTGVTTLVTTVASRQSATQITLSAANASGGAVSGAVVIWGTDDTAAIQAAVNAAESYLATHTYAQVYFPPRPYIVAGALNNTKSGNGQVVFGPYAMTGDQRTLHFAGASIAAPVRSWLQTVPVTSGACLISLGVYASTSAQTTNINADGNPGVISGPNEGFGYGAAATFSNMMAVITNLSIITTHSSFGLTYGAANLWGCAKAHIDNLAYGTAGTVASPSTDYTSPGTFGTGLSVGLLLPAPGNNDHVVARNVSCNGGYTYGLFLTEHAVVERFMALYCWAGLCVIGNYAGSVGSVHAMDVVSASIEACINEVYIVGAGSAGVGPTIYANISTESSTPNIGGNSAAAMNAALGQIRLTGLFTETGVSVDNPTGIEIINGQIPRAIKRKTTGFTCSPIDRVLVCDTTAAGFTGTLPAADFCPTEYLFKNVGANTLTVATTSSQLIYTTSTAGATTATVAPGQTLQVQALYNGSSWGWYAVNYTPTPDVQVFTSSGTWTKPAGAQTVSVLLLSGGGGGGSGRRGAAGTVRCGGGGGAGAAALQAQIQASQLTSTVAVTVGTGGAGGAARTTDDTDGATGGTGGASSFGSYFRTGSSNGGAGGTATAGAGGTGGVGSTGGVTGGAASTTGGTGSNGSPGVMAAASGAAGGGITSGNSASNGGQGGANGANSAGLAGAVGGSTPTSPTDAPANSGLSGGGGGGGAASITGVAQTGAAGGLYGGGGGGGGASLNGNNSGGGGAGANGIAIVTTYF